jgi:hypothetical protein
MSLPDPSPIAEFENVERRRFDEEIRPTGQPAILRGLVAHWPAVTAAEISPETLVAYLMERHAEQPLTALVGDPEIGGRFFYREDVRAFNFNRGQTTLGAFLGRLLRDRDNPHPYAIAIQSVPIPPVLPGFERENAMDLLDPSVVPRAWIGNAIRVAPHYDLKENIGCVVAGRRRFTLFPPEQISNLYPGPLELTPAGTPVSMVDLQNPDLDRHPRFREAAAVAQTATLEPGDAIYIPYHWWHAVDSLAPVNLFVNYWWNDAPDDLGSPYDTLMHALLSLRDLPDDQRSIWRTVFDHYVFCTSGDPAEHLPPEARGILGPAAPERTRRIKATLKQIFNKF